MDNIFKNKKIRTFIYIFGFGGSVGTIIGTVVSRFIFPESMYSLDNILLKILINIAFVLIITLPVFLFWRKKLFNKEAK